MSFKLNSNLIYYLNNMENQILKETDMCIPIYSNQNYMKIKFKFTTKKCCCTKNEFELININNEWELTQSNGQKYFLVASDSIQFSNIILNLGIKNKNYEITAIEVYNYKKINCFKNDNLKDCIQWCMDTDRDMKNVRRCLY